PLKTLNFSYNFDLQNTVTNKVEQEFGVDPDLVASFDEPDLVPFTPSNFGYLLQNAKNGARNRIPVSSNFTLFKYFTGTASASLTELWYLKRINYFYNPEEERVDKIIEDGFNRVTFYSSSF